MRSLAKLFLPIIAAGLGAASTSVADESVTVPLELWKEKQDRLADLRAADERRAGESEVVVGETIYRGRSDGRNLHLTLTLRADLARSDAFKTVEVLGADAVILSARAGKQPIALSQRGRRWVWQTTKSGPVEIEVELVIAPRGPRGSIEYAFEVIKSPITEIVARFPGRDLSPQVTEAVANRVRVENGATILEAQLSPTETIHIVGFHDIDAEDKGREAKLYGQTMSLVSLADDYVDLFSVIDVAILYAPARRFQVELPAGYDLVSADGEGAFQYTVEAIAGRRVLAGETAVGIKQHYQISLRLHRTLATTEREIVLQVPRLRDAERDAGFVAVEIPGKLSIERVDPKDMVGIDVRELPAPILRSSVSPIVRALRYTGLRAAAVVEVARHPEKALAAGGVDALRATSVVTEDGRVMTDLAFTIRNSLQQYLAVVLDPGAEVKSAVLDGDPIKPSKDATGRVLVPLRRSKRGPSGLVPLVVQLVYETKIVPLGAFGARPLELPRIVAPVSSVEWSVYVPRTYGASKLHSEVAPAVFLKNARWQRGPAESGAEEAEDAPDLGAGALGDGEDANAGPEDEDEDDGKVIGSAAATPSGDRASGAMPVRVQLPRDGHQLVHRRFWVDAEDPVKVELRYLVTPLPLVLEALAAAVLAALAAILALRRRAHLARLAAAVTRYAKATGEHTRSELVRASGGLWAELEERRKKTLLLFAVLAPSTRIAWIAAKLTALGVVSAILLVQVLRLIALLQNPL
jgi:hypothetical protein